MVERLEDLRSKGETAGKAASRAEVEKLERTIADLNQELVNLHRRKADNADRELELMKSNKKLEVTVAEQEKQLDELNLTKDELSIDKANLKTQVQTQQIELQVRCSPTAAAGDRVVGTAHPLQLIAPPRRRSWMSTLLCSWHTRARRTTSRLSRRRTTSCCPGGCS